MALPTERQRNRRSNRLFMKIAGRRWRAYSVVTHTGPRSGRQYRNPVSASPLGDGFVFAILYGTDSQWVRHVIATGQFTLTTKRPGDHAAPARDDPRLPGPAGVSALGTAEQARPAGSSTASGRTELPHRPDAHHPNHQHTLPPWVPVIRTPTSRVRRAAVSTQGTRPVLLVHRTPRSRPGRPAFHPAVSLRGHRSEHPSA